VRSSETLCRTLVAPSLAAGADVTATTGAATDEITCTMTSLRCDDVTADTMTSLRMPSFSRLTTSFPLDMISM